MRWSRVRLALLVVAVLAGFVLVTLTDVVDVRAVRDAVRASGPWAPLVYVVVAAALGALLVPGPVLAGASGLLFGAVTGTAVTLASAVLSALAACLVGRAAGHAGLVDLVGDERAERLHGTVRRHGTWVVVGQRLLPAVPDAPLSYAFGAAGMRMWQVGVGTLVGALPRAFSYTAIGASLDDPTSPLAVSGVVVLVVVGAAATAVAGGWWRRRRGAARSRDAPADEPPRGHGLV